MADSKSVASRSTEQSAKLFRKEKYKQAKDAFENRIDEMVIASYDAENTFPGDKFDAKTGLKIKGFWDNEKLLKWRETI